MISDIHSSSKEMQLLKTSFSFEEECEIYQYCCKRPVESVNIQISLKSLCENGIDKKNKYFSYWLKCWIYSWAILGHKLIVYEIRY